jgi:hypothetical protein
MLPSSSPPPTRRLVEVEAMATVLSAARLLRSLLSTRRLAEVVATGTASLLEFLAIQRTVTFNVSTTCALVFVLLHLLTSLTLGHIILTATPVSSSSLPPACTTPHRSPPYHHQRALPLHYLYINVHTTPPRVCVHTISFHLCTIFRHHHRHH